MGTNVIFDLLGSFVIGGMLLVNILNIQGNASSQSDLYSVTRITQKNLVTVASIIESDFRKIGYSVPNPNEAILYADSGRITFQSDLDRDGKVDVVTYYTGPTSELSSSPNPNDRLLYRIVNGEKPKSANLGVTNFTMKYYDIQMKPAKQVNQIKTIEITISIESPFPIENPATKKYEYPTAFWKQTRISSRNLTR